MELIQFLQLQQTCNVLGLFFREWPSLEIAARHDNPKRTESPKKTTAFNRTQTVCMLAAGISFAFVDGKERRRRSVHDNVALSLIGRRFVELLHLENESYGVLEYSEYSVIHMLLRL